MIVGISVFELHLPSSRSLKDKRRVVKSLVERIHQRFRVSVAETGFHDLHQRSEIAGDMRGQPRPKARFHPQAFRGLDPVVGQDLQARREGIARRNQ